jgi:CDP-diacylglycerol--glycerol-3-phosphate 3-phosphatidyltransferase
MQMTALFLLLLGSTGSKLFFVDSLGHIALWISALLTLITGYAYFRAALRYF